MKFRTRLIYILTIAVLALSACNLPSQTEGADAASTAAALTVQAMLNASPTAGAVVVLPTATPMAVLPTITLPPPPVASNTPAPTATTNCNVGQFITDVTVPDGTIMTPGQSFTKKWRIKNVGTCTWNGFNMVFDSGESMGGPASKAIAAVNPNQEIDLEVALTAPAAPGTYRGFWRIVTSGGVVVPIVNGTGGKSFYVDIKVQNPATATNTSVPAPAFSVTSVTYVLSTWSDATHTNCPRITANITTNAAGTVNYTWKTNSGTNSPQNLVFASAGTQSINYDWALGSVWNGTASYVGIFVNTPNNQDFGKLDFTIACTTP